MKKILIVTDMLVDFISEIGTLYIGPTGTAIIAPIAERIRKYLLNGDIVIFLCDAHKEDSPEFLRFPKHCVKGTEGAKVIPALSNLVSDNMIVIPKTTYDGTFGTNLGNILKQYDVGAPEMCEICGCCTSICCLFTAASIVNMGFPLMLHRDCVADFDQEAHAFALGHMEKILGVKVI